MKVSHYRFTIFFLACINIMGLVAQDVYLCVWRNPERTMTKIFPEARDYRTHNVSIDKTQLKALEDTLGFEILPGQRESFQYFEMIGESDQRIGTIIAASQKGEYGAIEFVVGFDNNNVINGLYIQRSRERNRSFKDRKFLDLFLGKKIIPISDVAGAYEGESSHGTRAVIEGMLKEFAAYDLLVQQVEKENESD